MVDGCARHSPADTAATGLDRTTFGVNGGGRETIQGAGSEQPRGRGIETQSGTLSSLARRKAPCCDFADLKELERDAEREEERDGGFHEPLCSSASAAAAALRSSIASLSVLSRQRILPWPSHGFRCHIPHQTPPIPHQGLVQLPCVTAHTPTRARRSPENTVTRRTASPPSDTGDVALP